MAETHYQGKAKKALEKLKAPGGPLSDDSIKKMDDAMNWAYGKMMEEKAGFGGREDVNSGILHKLMASNDAKEERLLGWMREVLMRDNRQQYICAFDATLSPGGRITIPLATMKMAGLTPGMILHVEVKSTKWIETGAITGEDEIAETGERAEARGKLRQLLSTISKLTIEQIDTLMPVREVIMEYIKMLGRPDTDKQGIEKMMDDCEKRLRVEVENVAGKAGKGKK